MNGGCRNAECIGNLCDIHQFSLWWVGWPLITSDVPLSAQTTDKIRSEAMTIRGSALLSVENTFLPLSLETAGDKTIIRVDGAIATLGALRFIACPFHRE